MTGPLDQLAAALRSEAALLRRWGAGSQAVAAEHAAARIEGALTEWSVEDLTVAAAAAESGYSEAHLRRLVAECRIANHGSPGRPRIRRGDLPRKPPHSSDSEPDLVGDVLRARERGGA